MMGTILLRSILDHGNESKCISIYIYISLSANYAVVDTGYFHGKKIKSQLGSSNKLASNWRWSLDELYYQ